MTCAGWWSTLASRTVVLCGRWRGRWRSIFECRRCRDHEELKEEVVALRQRVRELEGEKSSIGVQTEASDDVKRDDWDTSGGGWRR